MFDVKNLAKRAKKASRILAKTDTDTKNRVIQAIAELVITSQTDVLQANQADLTIGETEGLSSAMMDRLMLDSSRLEGIAADLLKIVTLVDPVGEVFDSTEMPNGLKVHKQRIPLGVVGVIYEARPNVTLDVAGIALKTGNAVVLRGGRESINTNRVFVKLIHQALKEVYLPEECIGFVDDPDRQRVLELLQLHDWIDILIPRGGARLHQFCRENSRIPVITGGIGICHLFIDESADLQASLLVIKNAKIQRPTVCNALDTVLVHRTIAAEFIPRMIRRLIAEGVEFRIDDNALPYLENYPDIGKNVGLAGVDDFDTEWLSLVLGIKVVDGISQAIDHIRAHSTAHSDGILTESLENARIFTTNIDSSVVYVNASTRFTDGGQLGLGSEVAVSTQPLHARGPMGLRELTTYKWVVQGNYHVRQ